MSGSNKYDVVVIGSGLGGMVCATILSKEGKRVCVIEKNEQIGGSLQTFRREGVTFDTGVHYIGGLAPGDNLYKIFNYLGIMQRLPVVRMAEDGFDIVQFNGDPVDYAYGIGYANFKHILTDKFPEEAAAVDTYCRDMKRICDSVPLYNLKPDDGYSETGFLTTSVKQYLEQLTANVTLQRVLAGTNLLYAGTPQTPLYIHALVVNSYIEGAYKVKHGGDQIVKQMARIIKENGGEVLRKHEVKRIVVENGMATSVELATGERIEADIFVSNLHPAKTLQLTPTDAIRPAYRNRISELENSVSTFVLYGVLKPGTMRLSNRNYYYFDNPDVWTAAEHTDADWPRMYAMFEEVPEKQSEYAEAFTVMTYMRYDEVKQWESTYNTTLTESERDAAYQAFKSRKAEKLLDVMEKKFAGLRNNLQSYYTSTPLSYRDYMGTTDGNMYGIAKDYREPMKTMISVKTKVPNLYLTGQSINLHGVLGVTECAILTCGAIIGKEYLLNKIHAANL
ncbi:MAG: hypothetical protein RLZZ367_2384 [Bacteroidota bacterium]|jgi:all-trans-retinol 13,14-reductase